MRVALLLLLAAPLASAAPLPPPPVLADGLVVGTWQARYGGDEGFVTFYADGVVYMRLGAWDYGGVWWISRADPGRVWVRELSGASYPLEFCARNGVTISGPAPGTRLTLTRPTK